MSQLIMHSLDGALMPILIKAEQLQKLLSEQEGTAFADATNWIEAYLQLTCEAPHYEMLRNAMAERSALLLIDGLDEAGAGRARIEQHIAEVLAPQGHALLATSRPAGLSAALFGGFHKLQLSPLSDAQQEGFLVQRLGAPRAAELNPYLRDKVPLDIEKRRVTANPYACPARAISYSPRPPSYSPRPPSYPTPPPTNLCLIAPPQSQSHSPS